MRKIRILSFFIICCLLLASAAPAALALEAPAVTAQSWIMVDLNTGKVIAEKNADEVRSPASLTKIMTGLLAVEAEDRGDVKMDEIVTAGYDCQTGLDSSSSNASIVAGEKMSFQDYFYCAMVVSANEACNVLGSRIAGSIGGFVDLMNLRAQELGLPNTHFADPNGLSSQNKTTARELSIILQEALRYETFAGAFTTTEYTVAKTNYNEQRELKTSNALTTHEGYYSQYGDYFYEPAVGGKTGFTRAAGYCLASVAEKGDLKVLSVVMGCPGPLTGDSAEPENFKDAILLYDWVFANFSYHEVLNSSEIIQRVPVDKAEGDGFVNLRCTTDLTLLLPSDVTPEDRQLDIELLEDLFVAPIEANTVLGRLTLHIGGEAYGPYDLINSSAVKIAKSEFVQEQVDDFFAAREVRIVIVVLALILILYFSLVLRYRALRRKHLREKKRAEKRRKAARKAQPQPEASPAEEPTLRFTAINTLERSADDIDLGRFFDEEAPAAPAKAADSGAPEDARKKGDPQPPEAPAQAESPSGEAKDAVKV